MLEGSLLWCLSAKYFSYLLFSSYMYPLLSFNFPLFNNDAHQFFLKVPHGIPYGLAVRIPGFHPGGPGSTPGMGMSFCQPFQYFKARMKINELN